MLGSTGANGGLLMNTALISRRIADIIGNQDEVVEIKVSSC